MQTALNKINVKEPINACSLAGVLIKILKYNAMVNIQTHVINYFFLSGFTNVISVHRVAVFQFQEQGVSVLARKKVNSFAYSALQSRPLKIKRNLKHINHLF